MTPYKGRFVIGIIAGVIGAAAGGFGLPYMIDNIFPVIFPDEKGSIDQSPEWLHSLAVSLGGEDRLEDFILYAACAMMPLVFIIRGVCTYANALLITRCGVGILEQIRIRVFDKLQRLPLAFHARQKGGDLVSRIMSDTAMIQSVIVQTVADLIIQPLTLVWILCYLVYKASITAGMGSVFIAMLTIPLCVLPIRFISKKLLKKARAMQGKVGDLSATTTENLASQAEIRSYNMEDAQVSAFTALSERFAKFTMKVVKYQKLTGPSVEIISAFGIALVIYQAAQNGMQLTDFVAVITALYFAYEPIKKLGNLQNLMKQGLASLERLETILLEEDTMPEPSQPLPFSKCEGRVTFENVSFRYDDDPVLSGLSFSVPAGQTVALVGASGAGKTTVVSLIERFYDVNEGRVRIDDIDVRDVTKKSLREQIAFVSQHPILFSGTIEENIRIGRPDASFEEVQQAAQNASATEFIESTDQGYQTVLGERGTGLSGGQRQRIAIARAFLKDAPILILDEATSALDSESESRIHESLMRLSEGRTTIVIAHRFSSIRGADRILVFEKSSDGGRITGDGDHETLLETHRVYEDLCRRQMVGGE